jgi:AcrR family transcriptional regulator
MPRWGPDADSRLIQAAMQLFLERGYDEVTVAEIAERAGLKKRSFFRYFPDKREVLFAGSAAFEHAILDSVRTAPAATRPIDAVIAALAEAGADLTSWGEPVRLRQRVIASSGELRERELMKLDALASAIADALRSRAVEDLTATLVAQAGVAAFTAAFQQWTETPPPQDFRLLIHNALGRLHEAICGPRLGAG